MRRGSVTPPYRANGEGPDGEAAKTAPFRAGVSGLRDRNVAAPELDPMWLDHDYPCRGQGVSAHPRSWALIGGRRSLSIRVSPYHLCYAVDTAARQALCCCQVSSCWHGLGFAHGSA